MSLAAHFSHKCTIQRADRQVDAYRNETLAWRDWRLEVPCRLVVKSQRIASDDRTEFTVVVTYALFVAPGLDVREDDRIVNVLLEDGAEDPGPYSVASGVTRRGRAAKHMRLDLERVT